MLIIDAIQATHLASPRFQQVTEHAWPPAEACDGKQLKALSPNPGDGWPENSVEPSGGSDPASFDPAGGVSVAVLEKAQTGHLAVLEEKGNHGLQGSIDEFRLGNRINRQAYLVRELRCPYVPTYLRSVSGPSSTTSLSNGTLGGSLDFGSIAFSRKRPAT